MKKGFSLVELLAVLLILAVVAMIAMPLVTNLIESSRKGTFRDSALGIMNSAKQSYVDYAGREMLVDIGNDMIIIDGEATGEKMTYKGSQPKGGQVRVNKDGKVSLMIYSDKYCAYKSINDDDITVELLSKTNKCD